MRRQPSPPAQEADWQHGPRVHCPEAARTAGLSGCRYSASFAVRRPARQEISGPQQLFCQLHRWVPGNFPFSFHFPRGNISGTST